MKRSIVLAQIVLALSFLPACTPPTTSTDDETIAESKIEESDPTLVSFIREEFDKWPAKKQAEFVEELDTKQKIQFLAIFLPGHTFMYLPNAYVKFLSNGEFVYEFEHDYGGPHHEPDENEPKYFIGHWEVADGHIILREEKSVKRDTLFEDQEVWTDFYLELLERGTIEFNFVINDGGEDNIDNMFWVKKSPMRGIEEYCKTKGLE